MRFPISKSFLSMLRMIFSSGVGRCAAAAPSGDGADAILMRNPFSNLPGITNAWLGGSAARAKGLTIFSPRRWNERTVSSGGSEIRSASTSASACGWIDAFEIRDFLEARFQKYAVRDLHREPGTRIELQDLDSFIRQREIDGKIADLAHFLTLRRSLQYAVPVRKRERIHAVAVGEKGHKASVLDAIGGFSRSQIDPQSDRPQMQVCLAMGFGRGEAQHRHDGDEVEDNHTHIRKPGGRTGAEIFVRFKPFFNNDFIPKPGDGVFAAEDGDAGAKQIAPRHALSRDAHEGVPPGFPDDYDSFSAESVVGFYHEAVRQRGRLEVLQFLVGADDRVYFCRSDAARREKVFGIDFIIRETLVRARVIALDIEQIAGVHAQNSSSLSEKHNKFAVLRVNISGISCVR